MGRAKAKPTHHIMMSGFDANYFAGVDWGRQISKLGGVFYDNNKYEFSCTHLICYKLSRSEKFLCACAAGIWILIPKYLEDCIAAKCWLPEADYEWTRKHSINQLLHSLPLCFYNAPRRNRLAVEATGKGRFFGWIATVVLENVERKAVYERLLSSGGATVVSAPMSILKGRSLKQLTIVLVEIDGVAKVRLAMDQNIPCIYPAFLRTFLIMDENPKSNFFDLLSYNPTNDPLMVAIEQASSRPNTRFGRVLDNCLGQVNKSNAKKPSDTGKQAQSIVDLAPKKRGRQRLQGGQELNKKTKLAPKETANDGAKLQIGPMDRFLLRSPKPDAFIPNLEPTIPVCALPIIDKPAAIPPVSRKRAALPSTNTAFVAPAISQSTKRVTTFMASVSQIEVPSSNRTATGQFTKRITTVAASDSKIEAPSSKRTATGQSTKRVTTVAASDCEFEAPSSKGAATSDSDESGVIVVSSPDRASSPRVGSAATVESPWYSSVPRSTITAAVHDFLQYRNAVEVVKSTEEEKYCVSLSTMNTSSTCEEIGRWATNIHDSYSNYPGFERNALEYLSKIVLTKKSYPPASTVAHFLWTARKNVSCRVVLLCAQRFWRSLLTVHPPTAPGFQLYYQKILCGTGTKAATWDLFFGWSNVLDLLEFEDLPEHTLFGNQLALQFVVDILMIDFQFTSQRSSSSYKTTPLLITKLVWPSSEVGTYNLSVDKLVQHCVQLWNNVDSTDARILDLCLQLILMVAESCRLHDCRHTPSSSSLPFVLGVTAEKLSLGIAKQLVGAGVELTTVCKWLPRLRPRWLRLKVSTLLLCHFTGLTPMHRQSASRNSLSLTSIVNAVFVKKQEQSLPEQQQKTHNIPRPVRSRKVKFSSAVKCKNNHTTVLTTQPFTRKSITKVNGKGETQLHLACMKNNVERVRILLGSPDINVNAQDHAGWSALHEVCNRGHIECLRELLAYRPKKTIRGYFTKDQPDENGLNLMVTTPEGITPLHDAVMSGKLEAARILLKHGGPCLLEVKLVNGRTPLDCTAWSQMKDMLQEFKTRAGRVDESDKGIALDVSQVGDTQLRPNDSVCLRRASSANPEDLVACYRLSMQCIGSYVTVAELGQLSDILKRRVRSGRRSTDSCVNRHKGNERAVGQLVADLEQLLELPQLCFSAQRHHGLDDKWLNGILLSCNLV